MPDPGGEAQGKTILLIDDEPATGDLCELMLRALGHRVLKARSGPEGLALYEANRHRVDLIISDYHMPEMSGQEVVDQLRGRGHRVKVLLATGGLGAEEERRAVLRGFSGVLRKPYTIGTLAQKIADSLNRATSAAPRVPCAAAAV